MRILAISTALLAGIFAGSLADAAQTVAQPAAPCVDVQIGGDRSAALNCLNRVFEQQVTREHQVPPPTAPIDAQSPSTAVGTANTAAAEEKMGDQFGKSATPQRPQLIWTNPILAPAPH